MAYLIATTPRTGSSLLCDLLEACGAGSPWEYFSRWHEGNLEDQTLEDYWEYIVEHHSGAKVFGEHLDSFPGLRASWDRLFSGVQIIHLEREDKLLQAVSAAMTHQTQRWHSDQPLKGTVDVVYDPEAIGKWLDRIFAGEAAWEDLFERKGIEPYRMTYEGLVSDMERSIKDLLNWLGLPCPDVIPPPKKQKLGNDTNIQWAERFRREEM